MVSDSFVYALAALKLCFVVIFLPAYLCVIWIFAIRTIFASNVVYKIMLHMGVMNCLHLLATAYACVIDFLPAAYNFQIIKGLSYVRYSHTWAIPLLNLILAANRLYVVLRINAASHKNAAFKVFQTSIYLVWMTIFIFPVFFYMSGIDYGYKTRAHTYYHDDTNILAEALTYFSLTVNSATLLAYLVLVIGLAYQRFLYASSVKVSSVERRMLYQAVVTFVVFAGTATLGNYFPEEANLYITTAFTVILALIPCIVFAIHVGLNSLVRKHFIQFVTRNTLKMTTPVVLVEGSKISNATAGTRRSSIMAHVA